uniref:Uncharacterized protein n=1 Tax=Geospiza parvula TaxID=87175 RepID=A0A8U8C5S2_GEOPR
MLEKTSKAIWCFLRPPKDGKNEIFPWSEVGRSRRTRIQEEPGSPLANPGGCGAPSQLVVKPFPHWGHSNGFFPVWLRWCTTSLDLCLNPLPQSGQQNGLSLVCISWWLRRWDLGLSPVWVRRCLTRAEFSLKLIPHSGQRNGLSPCASGFSPVWVLRWLLRWDLQGKPFPQYGHT